MANQQTATNEPTVPMLGSDGSIADIPQSRAAEAASKGGYKLGVEMVGKDGSKAVIPADRAHDAMTSGGFMPVSSAAAPQIAAATASKPQVEMKEDAGPAPAGKLSGLPGVNPHTPTVGEAAGDVALAAAPLTVPLIEAAPGALEAIKVAAKSHPFVARLITAGLTGLVGGAGFAKGSKLVKLLAGE